MVDSEELRPLSICDIKKGIYWIDSHKDPRFTHEWEEKEILQFGTPTFIDDWIKEREKELDVNAPEDIIIGIKCTERVENDR